MRPRRATARIVLALGIAVAGCASGLTGPSIATTTPLGISERIPIELSKPEGSGPFPAVVIMHDCSGLGPRSSGAPFRWARELGGRGYVVLMPDSFTTRGYVDGVCTDASLSRDDVSPPPGARCLCGARPSPDPAVRRRRARRAHGRLARRLDDAHVDDRPGERRGPSGEGEARGFAAAVALYPGCVASRRTWTSAGVYRPVAPLLILIGDKDDWTPAEPCRKLTEAARQAGYPVMIKIYPGAYHSFDSNAPVRYVAARVNANAPGGRGATTGGDPAAWGDSVREVVAFFDRYLRQRVTAPSGVAPAARSRRSARR
jgi:dienelactone hydrolase